MDIIKAIEKEYIKEEKPVYNIGDTVNVHVKIKEGNRERIQVFTGTVIKEQNSGLNKTFTVRKISNGIGVERTFPVNSPKIEKVEVTREGKVRRAKLYYLRDRVGKAAKTKEVAGARIENKEIIIKGEEAPAAEEVVEAPAEVAETVEAPVAESTENKAE